MRCDQVREWLSATLDGESTPSERQAVDRHLATCSDCRQVKAAGESLRVGLLSAASHYPNRDALDDQVIVALVGAGVIQKRDIIAGRGTGEPESGAAERDVQRRQRLGLPVLRSALRIPAWERLRPAAVAMAVAFLLTWWPLRLAERGSRSEVRNAAQVSAPGRGLADRLLSAGWLLPPGDLATVLVGKREAGERRPLQVSPSQPLPLDARGAGA
jgi:anti-sigma factor RsiW